MKTKNNLQQNIFLFTVLLGMLAFIMLLPRDLSREGIYILGNGQGVLVCDEAITLNANSNVSESDLFDMFDEALLKLEDCKSFK